MKRFLLIVALFLGFQSVFATHNRAGEITYRHINGFTYEVTITTYTKNSVAADRCELLLNWGDSSSATLIRSNGLGGDCPSPATNGEVIAGTDVKKNVYVGVHTYRTFGVYIVSFEDPNRNSGIANIIQSVNVPFFVQSELVISSTLGPNSSPTLLNPPIDDGCAKRIFKHNTGAFDIDGDSLSYELVECRSSDGQIITTTYDPNFVQDSLRIDSITGDLIWDVPQQIGQFNFAVRINEFRKDLNGAWVRIGYVTRDLQIDIKGCANQPPEIQPIGPFCVEAGQTLNFDVTAIDPDGDPIVMTAVGGPFAVSSPALPFNAQGSSPLTGTFVWPTECSHVRKQPYFVTFEAVDVNIQPLLDLYTVEITVVAPAPQNPVATGTLNSVDLSWDQSICDEAIGYRVYRRENTFGFIPDDCETGVPGYTGYELIADIDGLANTSYIDSFELQRGVRYCYMVIAYFEDEAESYASIEFCAALPLTAPMLTNVDVLSTDVANGDISIHWIYPPELDSNVFPPPYTFNISRATGLEGTNFTLLQSNLVDTFFTDAGLNTLDSAYRYKVDLFSGTNSTLVGSSDPASSVFLEVTGFDEGNLLEFTHNTPWFNNEYIVFRETPTGSGNFDIIDTTFSDSYRDTGLVNGDQYCYRVRAFGDYTVNSNLIPSPLINNSQINCGVPIDTSAPCTPELSFEYLCEEDSLILSWAQPLDPNCVQDIQFYNLYYKSQEADDFPETPLFQFLGSQTQVTFTANDGRPLVGCYAVSAVDDADQDVGGEANESLLSEIACFEACPLINFPNVFSPNGDPSNRVFTAVSYKDIRSLSITIYNRWGTEVYKTNDGIVFLEEGWDGVDSFTGQPCSEGVYYYVCEYSTLTIQESTDQVVSGFVHLFR